MGISIIVAASTNNVIGKDGHLPWRLPEDLKRFKRLTTGKPVIMGRLTYESIGKPLPDRQNIVVSTRKGLEIDGCEVAASPGDALSLAANAEEVMVIGGGRIYVRMLPMADRIYMTRVNTHIDGDTYFPKIRDAEWRVVDCEDSPANKSRQFGLSFITMDRVNSVV
ncbi:MAG: dihydrofolate reductase [Woeseia sp.]